MNDRLLLTQIYEKLLRGGMAHSDMTMSELRGIILETPLRRDTSSSAKPLETASMLGARLNALGLLNET